MVNWGNIIPITVAFIGILGTVTPLLITRYFEDGPYINIDIVPNYKGDSRRAYIELTNTGSSAATNVSLLVEAPKKVIDVTDKFSTSKITSLKLKESRFEMQIPKFVQGSGSKVILETLIDGEQTLTKYKNYTAFITYDQGSNSYYTIPIAPSSFPEMLKPLSEAGVPLRSLTSFYVILGGFIVIWLFLRIRKKRRKLYFVCQILNILLKVRNSLKSDQKYGLILEGINSKDKTITNGDLRSVFDIKDYIIIDDFFAVLVSRNEYISNNTTIMDENRLQKLNENCLYSAEKGLKAVDWKKYTS